MRSLEETHDSFEHEIDEGYQSSDSDSSIDTSSDKSSELTATHNNQDQDQDMVAIFQSANDFLAGQKDKKKTKITLRTLMSLDEKNVSNTEKSKLILDVLTCEDSTLTRFFKPKNKHKHDFDINTMIHLRKNHSQELKNLFCKKISALDNHLMAKGEKTSSIDKPLLNHVKKMTKEDPSLIKILVDSPRLLNMISAECTPQEFIVLLKVLSGTNEEEVLFDTPESKMQEHKKMAADKSVETLKGMIKHFINANQQQLKDSHSENNNLSKEDIATILVATAEVFWEQPSGDLLLTDLLIDLINENVIDVDLNTLDMSLQTVISGAAFYTFANEDIDEKLELLEKNRPNLKHKQALLEHLGEYQTMTTETPPKKIPTDYKLFYLMTEQLYEKILSTSDSKASTTFKSYIQFLTAQAKLTKDEDSVKHVSEDGTKGTKTNNKIDPLSSFFREQLKEISSTKLAHLTSDKEKAINDIMSNIQTNLVREGCDGMTEIMILQFYGTLLESISRNNR